MVQHFKTVEGSFGVGTPVIRSQSWRSPHAPLLALLPPQQ